MLPLYANNRWIPKYCGNNVYFGSTILKNVFPLPCWVILENISEFRRDLQQIYCVFVSWCQATLGCLLACRRGLLCAREAHAWTGTARGISVPLSGHTSHTRRWHWLYIRDSLTSPSVSSLSPLLFFYSTRSSECCLHCGDPDRCGGPDGRSRTGKSLKG